MSAGDELFAQGGVELGASIVITKAGDREDAPWLLSCCRKNQGRDRQVFLRRGQTIDVGPGGVEEAQILGGEETPLVCARDEVPLIAVDSRGDHGDLLIGECVVLIDACGACEGDGEVQVVA